VKTVILALAERLFLRAPLTAREAGVRSGVPNRVVSLNYCADRLLLLPAPQNAAGITPFAGDPTISVAAIRIGADLPAAEALAAAAAAFGLPVGADPEPRLLAP
jgi:hypothetical protein